MAKRLIDADALIKAHCEGCSPEVQESCKTDPICASMMWIVEAPTVDAVEVVRCRDCKHLEDGPYDNGDMMCVRWGEWIFPNDDDFCSSGERKEK